MPDSKLPELPAPRIKYGYEWKVPVAKYDYFDADQMRALQIATWNAAMEAAAVAMPDTWLDPLLTGKGGMGQPPYSCPDIERLLTKLRAAIRALKEPQ